MPFNRDEALRTADKRLREGRVDRAIVEYERIVREQPSDWTSVNTLGDLYAQAGRADPAIEQYVRVADQFAAEGFILKAAALYKKILKLNPSHEHALVHAGELAARQGLVSEAKSCLTSVAELRLARGDRPGAAESYLMLAGLAPSDPTARLHAARSAAELGDTRGAVAAYEQIAEEFRRHGKTVQQVHALSEAALVEPGNVRVRAALARAYAAQGELKQARSCVQGAAADDPLLLLATGEIEIQEGQPAVARDCWQRMLDLSPPHRDDLIKLGHLWLQERPDAAFLCVDVAANHAAREGKLQAAVSILRDFLTRVPGCIEALMSLSEICSRAGLEDEMRAAEACLADAYLGAGRRDEAKTLVEKLLASDPANQAAHRERWNRLHAPSVPGTQTAPKAPQSAVSNATGDEGLKRPKARAGSDVAPTDVQEIDLTSFLEGLAPAGGEALDRTSSSRATRSDTLGDAFGEFRAEISRDSAMEDAERQYRLGLTFKEMGMEAEAITALELAAQSPRQRFEAGALLARTLMQRNELRAAITWFERAAEAPAPSVDAGLTLLYDLGRALEASGEHGRALAVFRDLKAAAGEFRDVSARIHALRNHR